MLLHWSSVYETGHPDIDEQHKRIIEEMNQLHEAINERRDVEAIFAILEFMTSYVEDHFSFEEKCVEEFKCPHAEENKTAHVAFVALLKESKAKFEKGEVNHAGAMDFYYEIVIWIKEHILQVDKHNFSCVKDQLKKKFG